MNKIEKSNKKAFTKIYKYIQNQDFTKLQKFIVKESNKNRKIALKKSRFKEFIRKILTRKCNRGKKVNLIVLDELHSYKENEMFNNIIALNPEEHHRVNNNDIKHLYRAEYMQNPFEILTEENFERLEKHCKKTIHYERGEIKKEHEVTLCLLYRYQEQQEKMEKRNKIIDLMAEQLAGLAIFDNNIENALILGDKEEVKNYYERKAANEEK